LFPLGRMPFARRAGNPAASAIAVEAWSAGGVIQVRPQCAHRVRPGRKNSCLYLSRMSNTFQDDFLDSILHSDCMPVPPIKRILQSFKKHLRAQGKHENTIRSYVNDVNVFLEWLSHTIGQSFSVRDISEADVRDFKSFLLTRNASNTSINRRLTALRQFFLFCAERKYIRGNPAAGVPALPSAPASVKLLSRKEQLLLLRTVENMNRPLERVILLLLIHAGMRSSEICNLKVADLHMSSREGKLFIRDERGQKYRFVKLSSRAQAAMRLYCKSRRIRMFSRRRDEPLLKQRNGNPLTQQVIDHIVKRVGKHAGIVDITPTMLRNTYTVQLLLSGEPPDKVALRLGTKSIAALKRVADQMKENDRR